MKKISLLVFVFINTLTFLSAQKAKETIQINCQIENCVSSLKLMNFDGFSFNTVDEANAKGEEAVVFMIPAQAEASFYYIGPSEFDMRPFIAGTEASITIAGPCKNLRNAKISNSPLNEEYESFKKDLNKLKRRSQVINSKMRKATSIEKDALLDELASLDQDKLKLLEKYKDSNAILREGAALNTYLSYQHNGGKYKNEIEYFIYEYFKYANFSAPIYNKLPWVYESFKSYTQTIASIPIPDEPKKKALEMALSKVDKESAAYMLALGGVVNALERKKDANYVYFVEKAAALLEAKGHPAAADMKKKLNAAKQFSKGGQAPDFTSQTPEGEDFSLSDLKGKVVLLDFWASWCGPCRRENPNVVKMYNKYHEKGFDVLGISLDRKKDAWTKAIKADKLTWHHVSDLKGWSNEVSKLYGVRSIPHTILLDREGKIIAKNLRGPALEAKLKELFE